MRALFLTLLLFIITPSISAQSIIGKWKTINDETGEPKSVVQIYKKENQFYGKVVHIIDPTKKSNNCKLCTDSRKNQPIIGMEIIKNLNQDEEEYEDGTILDPNNGKIYDCKIWLKDTNTLNVRGYVGFFYRTQEWIRVQ
jgi:uncharacterized protein (DUF2147 family)